MFGNVPFLANNVPAVYEKIKNDRLTFPSDIVISDELRDVISKMLEKDPSKRITLPMLKVCVHCAMAKLRLFFCFFVFAWKMILFFLNSLI